MSPTEVTEPVVETPTPHTRDELEEILDDLLCEAAANDVDFDDDSLTLRHEDPDVPDWEVVISPVTKTCSVLDD